MREVTEREWEEFTTGFRDVHLLQTVAWGEFKRNFGWQPVRVISGDAGAQVLFRKLPLGFTVGYIPKGPPGNHWGGLLEGIDTLCRKKKAIFLKVEPDAWEPLSADFVNQLSGFSPARTVQPNRTIVISLEGNEADWQARMKQKTRYNINLAQKKDICIETSSDVSGFYRLMIETGKRDNFEIHSLDYFSKCFQIFSSRNECQLLKASYLNKELAYLMVFWRGDRAWYFYGVSGDEERNRMPTYLLQWEAMRLAAHMGCKTYDLWGIPDEEETILEGSFQSRTDGLWRVYRFKRGFGGDVLRAAGAWDRIYNPFLYNIIRLKDRNT